MRHAAATREDLRRVAMWLTVEEPQLRSVIDQALDTVERVAVAPFWDVARRNVHSVEMPFLLSDSARLTNGVIDLVFSSDAGWQIVDYKTDQSLEPARYAEQLDAYRKAMKIQGCSVTAASVFSVRTDPA